MNNYVVVNRVSCNMFQHVSNILYSIDLTLGVASRREITLRMSCVISWTTQTETCWCVSHAVEGVQWFLG
jgi:hypothetical protein